MENDRANKSETHLHSTLYKFRNYPYPQILSADAQCLKDDFLELAKRHTTSTMLKPNRVSEHRKNLKKLQDLEKELEEASQARDQWKKKHDELADKMDELLRYNDNLRKDKDSFLRRDEKDKRRYLLDPTYNPLKEAMPKQESEQSSSQTNELSSSLNTIDQQIR